MSIPLLSKITSGAIPAPNPIGGNILSLFDCLSECCNFVPMQFKFNNQNNWYVDLSFGYLKPPIQKISNIYIDALNSTHDVILYFPDTGYMVHVGAGTSAFLPSLVSRGAYKFFVALLNGATSNTDIVNVFALDSNLPFFDTLWMYPNGLNGNKSTWMFVGEASGPPANSSVYYNTVNAGGGNLNANPSQVFFTTPSITKLVSLIISINFAGAIPPSQSQTLPCKFNLKLVNINGTFFDQTFTCSTNSGDGYSTNDNFNINQNNINLSVNGAMQFEFNLLQGQAYGNSFNNIGFTMFYQ